MHVVQDEVDSARALEDELHIYYKWVVDLKHYQLFEINAFY